MAIAKTGVYNNIFDCISKLSRELGMRSFYKGILPSLIGIVPNAGIDLCIYEVRKLSLLAQLQGFVTFKEQNLALKIEIILIRRNI